MAIKVEINNQQRIEINASYTARDRIKSIPGARWSKDNRLWSVPLSWAACKQLRTTFAAELEIGSELLEWAQNEVKTRIAPAMDLRDELGTGLADKSVGLYDFQNAGVQFLLTAKQAILGDVVGSGKTLQTIIAAKKVNALPALVVCPASVRIFWKREIEKWWSGVPVYVVQGTAAKRAQILREASNNPGWIIANWEVIRLHSRLAPYGSISLTDKEKEPKELNNLDFRLVIADEAHRMKDPKSKQTRAVWAIGQGPLVQYRWALTGTPLTNQIDTLFPILHFLDPNEWPSKTQFIERYALSTWNVWGGLEIYGIRPEMEKEFFEVFDSRFRRMPKEVVLPQLPPIQRIRKNVDMHPKQAKAYQAMADNMVAQLDSEGSLLIAQNPIAQLTRLVQFSSAYVEFNTEGQARLSDPSCKLDALMDDLGDYLPAGEGVVVFAQSRQLIEMAEKRLEKANISYSVIKGGQSVTDRQLAIDNFQEEKVQVILVVIQAGGTGITLTRGRIAIFLQRSFSKVDMLQAEGRIHRIGSERHGEILIVDYIANNSIENDQLDILENKALALEAIVKDKATIRKLLNGTYSA